MPVLDVEEHGSGSGSSSAIVDWLFSVTCASASDEQTRKRRRIEPKPPQLTSRPSLPSPCSSVAGIQDSYLMESAGSARKRLEDAHEKSLPGQQGQQHVQQHVQRSSPEEDSDQHLSTPTPRASRLATDRIIPVAPSITSSTRSSTSRTSSPTKQLRRLGLEPDGFEHNKFAVSRGSLPTSLAKLEREMRAIARGNDILSYEAQAQLRDVDIPLHAFAHITTVDDTSSSMGPSRYPSKELIAYILQQAVECELNMHGECSWNMELHRPILEWAFRPDKNRRHLIDFVYCSGAQVLRAYKADKTPSNMVDFCVVIRPPRDHPAAARIDALRKARPDVSINHTDHGILCSSPIAISIETKRPCGDLGKATLQMGTWHAAQWRSLLYDDADADILSFVEFLPGIIVDGHNWYFVASTLREKERKSVLYSEVLLGSTSDEFGIVTILMALQHLGQWVETVYWPSLQRGFLRIEI